MEADAAYQGTAGAFSEDAARALLGAAATLRPCPTLEDVFAAVTRADARRAVVPIENTLAGAVPGCADLVGRSGVRIVAERVHPIAHALIAPPGASIAGLRHVRSHPVALAQCARFLADHPEVTPIPALDTAGAVADVMTEGRTDIAAIASRRAAAVHGAAVLADDIQDSPDNFTRFLLLERGDVRGPLQAGRKTSLVCVLPNEPGTLVRALQPFADLGLNLCRIESRPVREAPFEYQFHLDISAAEDVAALEEAVGRLRARSRSFRILGQYPAAAWPPPGR